VQAEAFSSAEVVMVRIRLSGRLPGKCPRRRERCHAGRAECSRGESRARGVPWARRRGRANRSRRKPHLPAGRGRCGSARAHPHGQKPYRLIHRWRCKRGLIPTTGALTQVYGKRIDASTMNGRISLVRSSERCGGFDLAAGASRGRGGAVRCAGICGHRGPSPGRSAAWIHRRTVQRRRERVQR